MTDEKFNQPIFGACSISGLVAPVRLAALLPVDWLDGLNLMGTLLLIS